MPAELSDFSELVLSDAKDRERKTLEALRREFATVRTGRANAGLIEHIRAEYYGVPTPLNQIASIAIPEAHLIVIQPWDRSALGAIEKAIQKSELGINPNNDGSVIRLAIPPLTEDRRRELVRQVHRMAEEARVAARNIRRDALEDLRKSLKAKEISEDEERRAAEMLQKQTDDATHAVDRMMREKEQELMEV